MFKWRFIISSESLDPKKQVLKCWEELVPALEQKCPQWALPHGELVASTFLEMLPGGSASVHSTHQIPYNETPGSPIIYLFIEISYQYTSLCIMVTPQKMASHSGDCVYIPTEPHGGQNPVGFQMGHTQCRYSIHPYGAPYSSDSLYTSKQ